MDTALKLKMDADRGISLSRNGALKILEQSNLIKKLTNDLVEKPLFYIWRLIALSEIPYAQHLKYTEDLIDRIVDKLSTPYGFSLSGDEKHFLPCYNAMLVSAMCKLGQAKSDHVLNAVEWINMHQPMERGKSVSIPNLRFDRYGGCFKNTPCYIGVAKSVFALFDYQEKTKDKSVNVKLKQGIEYLLQHHLIRKQHEDGPITKHILDISFPESYHLNIVELIRFAGKANIINDPRTNYAIEYLQNKKKNTKGWKTSFQYQSEGYIAFDDAHKIGNWVTYIISNALNKNNEQHENCRK